MESPRAGAIRTNRRRWRTATAALLALEGLLGVSAEAAEKAPDFVWVAQAGAMSAKDDVKGMGVALDGAGNAYVVGTFAGTVDFGATNFAAFGFTDMFLAKYDPSGTLRWATHAGGNLSTTQGAKVAVDQRGNAYVTGSFFQSAAFGTNVLANTTASGDWDAFLAKYDTTGASLWAIRMGGSDTDRGVDVAYEPDFDTVIVVGTFGGTAAFGTNILGTSVVLTSPGGVLASFAAQYGGDGRIWKAGQHPGVIAAAAGDGTGGVYVVGDPDPSAFPKRSFEQDVIAPDVMDPIFDNTISGAAVGVTGLVGPYLLGTFSHTITIPSFPNVFSLTSAGGDDVLLAELGDLGDAFFADGMGGAGNEVAGAVASQAVRTGPGDFDIDLGVYLTGSFSQQAVFGSQTLDAGKGNRGIFIAKYDSVGNFEWATQAGPPLLDSLDDDQGTGIAVDAAGNVYVCGYFHGDTQFGGITVKTPPSPLLGLPPARMFLAKLRSTLASPGPSLAILKVPRTGLLITVTGSGSKYSLQTSTNLTAWASVTTLVATNGVAQFRDSWGGNTPARFYRALVSP